MLRVGEGGRERGGRDEEERGAGEKGGKGKEKGKQIN